MIVAITLLAVVLVLFLLGALEVDRLVDLDRVDDEVSDG